MNNMSANLMKTFGFLFYIFQDYWWFNVVLEYLDKYWVLRFPSPFLVQALRLRSNELKLERQLENSQAEISAYKYAKF